MQTELRRSTMEVFVGVGLVLSETLLLAFGLYTIYPVILSFWICLGVILVSELTTQLISFFILKKKTTWTIVCHVLQLGIFYRIVKLLMAEKKEFDADLRTIYRLRLLRALSGNLVLVSALGFVILNQQGTYVTWIPLLGILAIISISVSNLTQTPFFLAIFWRFCELTFRMTSLLVLTLAYGWWSSMALVLHWTAMFLWCFTHDLLKTTRRNDNMKTILINFRSSLILCFCYVDVRTMTSSKRTVAYYVIILAENWILYASWVLQSGLKHVAFLPVTVTMAVTSAVMVITVIVHCIIKRKQDIVKTVAIRQTHNYAKRVTPTSAATQHIAAHNGLTSIAECEIYEELSDSPRSEDSGNISPGSHTRLVNNNATAPQSVTSAMTVYTIAGHKFKVVDGALEGVQYSADKTPRARIPLPRQPRPSDSDCPYAITELIQGQGHHESRSRPQRCRSWSGRRGERSHSPEYETCGPASDSIYSSIPRTYQRTKLRPKLPRHHRQSSSSSGYDVTESDQSFSSPSPPQTLERDGVTSLTEIMDNLSKDSAIPMTDEKLRVSATKATARSRHPVSSSICTGVNSIFGESDFERSEYNSTISCVPDTRRTSKDQTVHLQPEQPVADVHSPHSLQSTAV